MTEECSTSIGFVTKQVDATYEKNTKKKKKKLI